MALVRTTTTAAVLESDVKIAVTSATGFAIGYQVRIGDGSGLSVRVQNAVDGGSPFTVGDKVGIDVPSGAARMLQD